MAAAKLAEGVSCSAAVGRDFSCSVSATPMMQSTRKPARASTMEKPALSARSWLRGSLGWNRGSGTVILLIVAPVRTRLTNAEFREDVAVSGCSKENMQILRNRAAATDFLGQK